MLYLSGERDVSVHCLHAQQEDLSYRYFNPSVAVVNGRVIASLRKVNLECSDVTGKFYILRPHTDLRNEIVLGEFDQDFVCLRQFDVDSGDRKTGASPYPVGFEDTRIFASPQGMLEGMACLPSTLHQVHADREMTFAANFSSKVSHLQFGPDFAIAKFTTYESPFQRRKEKNWSPFYFQGKLCVIYQWNPLIIMALVPDGSTRFLKWFHASSLLKNIRGGSPGIATRNGYLFVVHQRFHIEDKLRFTHRLLELNHDLQPLRISREFSFLSTGLIEYCAGLAKIDGRYLLTFGLNDSLPFALQISEEIVERMLVPFADLIAENQSILHASYEKQLTETSVDIPRDHELGRVRMIKLRLKEWLYRIRGGDLRG